MDWTHLKMDRHNGPNGTTFPRLFRKALGLSWFFNAKSWRRVPEDNWLFAKPRRPILLCLGTGVLHWAPLIERVVRTVFFCSCHCNAGRWKWKRWFAVCLHSSFSWLYFESLISGKKMAHTISYWQTQEYSFCLSRRLDRGIAVAPLCSRSRLFPLRVVKCHAAASWARLLARTTKRWRPRGKHGAQTYKCV